MPEPDPVAELDQPGFLGRGGGFGSESLEAGSPPEDRRVTERLRGRCDQQPAAVRREGVQAAQERLLEATSQRHGVAPSEDVRQLGCRPRPRQLEHGQRIAVRLGQDPVPNPAVQRAADHRVEEFPRVLGRQTPDRQLWERLEVRILDRLSNRDDHRDGLRQQGADESERLSGYVVQPLRVVDHAHERPLVGGAREQIEDGKPHHEPIRDRTDTQPERRAERVALRLGQPIEAIEEWPAELVEASVSQLHLRLDADTESRGSRQRGRPGSPEGRSFRCRAAPEAPVLARPFTSAGDEPLQDVALSAAATKLWSRLGRRQAILPGRSSSAGPTVAPLDPCAGLPRADVRPIG